MTQQRNAWRGALLCLLFAVSVASADDAEIFSSANASSGGPNIMFIIDTSGSMGSTVYSQPAYDPTVTYTATRCTTNFVAGMVYFAAGSRVPACGSLNYVPRAAFNCPTWAAAIDGAPGMVIDAAVGWKKSGSTSSSYDSAVWPSWLSPIGVAEAQTATTYQWSSSFAGYGGTSSAPTMIMCYADYTGATGSYPTASSSTSSAPQQTTTASASWWAVSGNTPVTYTFYSANYLNYLNSVQQTAQGSRLSVVTTAASNLINSMSNVNIGLMRYSDNSSQYASSGSCADLSAQGGMVVAPIAPIASNRTGLLNTLKSYQAGGCTPLSETMFEAFLYFSGGNVNFGNTSMVGTTPTPSVPASRVGNSASSAQYYSPVQYSCQKNFVVFLTDGLPTADNQADSLITALPNEATLGGACDDTTKPPYSSGNWGPGASAGKCLSALTKYMFNTDISNTLPGQQNIQTYFIGFGNDPQLASAFSYLQTAAQKGGGKAYTAGDLSSLQATLTSIFATIVQTSTTFTAPTVAVNAFNRTQTLNDLYVSVFQPSGNYHWPGNLKHYLLNNGAIVDANGQPAVDPATGFFKSSAQSLWSPSVDGTTVSAGGSANLLPNWNPSATPHRNVYTYVGANRPASPVTLSTGTNTTLSTANPLLTNTLLNAASTSVHDAIINYALGEDLRDTNGNGTTTETRFQMGDPMHSQPAAVIYGGSTANPDPNDGVVYVAENDGFLHAISTVTGVELWAFVPQEILPSLGSLYQDGAQPSKHYGIDGSLRVLKYDSNNDGVIDASAGDRVILYFGLGRGGSRYYALDVSDRNNPKFLWSLGPGDLPGLGQSWSTPQIARVQVGGNVQTSKQSLVLAFAGGYDPQEENPAYASADSTGNALYLVDAVAGTVLWSGGGPGSGAMQIFSRMDHAIASDLAILDSNGDGYADRIYVGDMAGQVWRFDITNGNPASSLLAGGVFASLGAHDLAAPTLADTRRFYGAPDVSLVSRRGQTPYFNIAIGSGYRGHPLNTAMQDRFYSLRDYNPYSALSAAQYASLVPVKDSDLTDITNTVTPTMPANAVGWKLLLNQPAGWVGEKVLNSATTINNQLLFTTYTPGQNSAAACQPTLGVNRFYAVSLIDGSPVANLNNQNNGAIGDRSATLAQTGIAPSLAFLFPAATPALDANGKPVPTSTQSNVLCMVGAEMLGSCKSFSSRVKTYWKESDAP